MNIRNPLWVLPVLLLPMIGSEGSEVLTADFGQVVANVEYSSFELSRNRPSTVLKAPEVTGDAWYGTIVRRLPGEGPWENRHYVLFMVTYADGVAVRAWCDTNLNGDLTDETELRFSDYPDPPGARSFLVDFAWEAPIESRKIEVQVKTRIVLDPLTAEAPRYREQRVYGMVGEVELGGKSHLGLLFDGNGDGLYTQDFGDGLFVDLDDDRHFEIDRLSSSFLPLGMASDIGGRRLQVVSVDPEGRRLRIKELGAAEARGPAKVGEEAPAFEIRDESGRTIRSADYSGRYLLVYFWASWCGVCAEQADALAKLYETYHPRGLEVLGVSFDVDRVAMAQFRARNRQQWPTSFSGRMLWEDPLGRLFQVRGTGSLYLIDPEGRVQGRYTDLVELSARLELGLPGEKPESN